MTAKPQYLIIELFHEAYADFSLFFSEYLALVKYSSTLKNKITNGKFL